MRHWQGLVLGLLTATVGCTTAPVVRSTAWLDRFRRGATPTGPDVVQMDVALIERPVGDRTLNDRLWTFADEQVVALEQRALLEDNGFRVGQVGGMPPPELQGLLTSEKSCATARRVTLRAGESKQLALGAPAVQCRYQAPRAGEPETVTLDQAQFVFEVVPTLTADGRTRLRFLPLVQHGEVTPVIRAAADRSGFLWQTEQPAERYSDLAWEVTLAPNEYVVVGGRYEAPATLGHSYFVRPDETVPVQRLLVIRTSRAAPAEALPGPDAANGAWSPPLASQASWSVVRGTSAP